MRVVLHALCGCEALADVGMHGAVRTIEHDSTWEYGESHPRASVCHGSVSLK